MSVAAQAAIDELRKHGASDEDIARFRIVHTDEIDGDFDLLVNATPVGMFPKIDNCPVSEDIIKLRNLKKIYRMGDEKIAAVNNVSLNFEKGSVTCLLGKSGSGKSTLLNLISGLEKPTKGEIIIHGLHV